MMKTRRMKGEGSIPVKRRKDGRFCAALTLPSGRRKFFYARSRHEVRLLLERAKSDLLRGLPVVSKNLTLSDWLDQWLKESVRDRVRPLTYQQYEQHCRLYLKPLLGRYWLTRLQAEDVQKFINTLLTKGFNPRTVQLSLFILRKALNQAQRFDLVQRNVALLVDSPRLIKKEVLPPSKQEVFQFLDAIKGHRLEAAFVLSVGLMLRRGEVLALRWQDISFENKSLSVNQQINRVGGRYVDGQKSKLRFAEPKSERSRRTLPLPQFVLTALEKQRTKSQTELVFHTARLTPIEPRRYDKEFKLVLRSASLPQDYRLHGLRHFGLSLLATLNVPPRTAMTIAGHADIQTTMEVYQHVPDESVREAMDKVQEVFGQG